MKLPVITPYLSTSVEHGSLREHSSWKHSHQAALPIFVATHLAFFLLTLLSPLFLIDDFSNNSLPISQLLHLWDRWDTGNFTAIATAGYTPLARTAFFPLYPLLIRGMMILIPNPLLAGLIISNLAGYFMLVILHRLVSADFGKEVASRSILLLATFPTAFFFAAAYNESLFLTLCLLSFILMRQRRFWLAGGVGLLASLTRSAGVLLLVPFIVEYVQYGRRRVDALAIVLIPVGTLLFAWYCLMQFHDPLAFMHAQANWQRHLDWPWQGWVEAYRVIRHRPLLSFFVLHNVIDLGASLFVSLFVLLLVVGPFRFRSGHGSYALYGVVLLLFPLLVPSGEPLPLASLARLSVEVWPAFVVLARIAVKYPSLERCATILFTLLLAFLLLQFLTGHWTV